MSSAVRNLRAQTDPPSTVAQRSNPAEISSSDELLAEETVETFASADAPSSSGLNRREALLASVTIFVLAIFVGFEVITKVPHTLHTPLMSGSNAISGVTLVGAVLVAGSSEHGFAKCLGMLAVAMAGVNAVGGFMVTDRMLGMFKGRG